jgi:hypothetical protein
MPIAYRAVVAAALLFLPLLPRAEAPSRCDQLIRALGERIVDPVCFESADLTTRNELTTPLNNSLPGLPLFAFTPRTDREVIAPDPAHRTPIGPDPVPGVQLQARLAGDPLGEARFLLRLPDDWNGRLVVAGASGTRSEFNGDFAWSDYVVQKGYAYASQNKGILNLRLSTAADPLACRLNPASGVYVHFYDNDPGAEFSRWNDFMIQAARVARRGVERHYGRGPARTYAVGTSNGGYQVRRAVETAPQLFDGGVDWEGTFVDATAQNLLTDLPPAVLNFAAYQASGFTDLLAAANIRAAGYPPDLTTGGTVPSLWGLYSASFWEVTLCQWQKRLDPAYATYVAGTGTYNYVARLSVSGVGEAMASFATTGRIQRPLVTVAGTMDALLPIDHHARAYARKVAAARAGDGDDRAEYRLWEIQNGNHIETYDQFFPQLELIEPHAQRAFDLLVEHVERRAPLPPDQCVPRGGAISASPATGGHCATLLAP